MTGETSKKTIRVLMLGQFARRRGENDGGVSAVMSYLSDALVRRGNIQLLGARVGAGVEADATDESLGFPIYNVATGSLGLLTAFKRQRARIAEIIQATRPDLVHGQGADVAGMLATQSGLPSIVTVHGIIGLDARFKTKLQDRVRETLISWLIERNVIRRSQSLILISPYVADYYGSSIRGRAYEISNPVDQDYFDLERRPEPGRVLFAGRVIPRKGVTDLISAFARLKGPSSRHLVIAGSLADTAYLDEVERMIRDQGVGDRVQFLGMLRDKELQSEFSKASALVLPSYQETAPMVILQAMAAGLPVIATRICGIPYQIDHGVSGFLYAPGDVDALTAQLGLLMDDDATALRMGEVARRIATNTCHAESVATATEAAYMETIRMARCP